MVSRQICVYLQEKKFNNKYNNDFLNMIYNLIALQAAGGNGAGTVSYTHLTLPTIYSV